MAVNLHTTKYRFGINELAETTHGWHAAENANPAQGVIAVDTTFLLRFTVQETGGTAAGNTDQQFQVAKNGGAFQNITTSSTIVKAVTTTVFADAADLTKRLTGTGTFESSGDGGTHDGLSGGIQNDIAASGNSETECALQIVSADVVTNDVLTFRLTSPDFTITNDVVPTLTVSESVSTPISVSDTASFTETFVKAPGKVLADMVAYTETLVKSVGKTVGDTLGLAEGFTAFKSFFATPADAVVFTEGFAKQVNKSLGETMALTEARLLSVGKGLVETLELAEGFTAVRTSITNLGDTLGMTELFTKSIAKQQAETVGLTEQLGTQVLPVGGGASSACRPSMSIAIRLGI
jgi:hypothetical protein